MRIDVPLVLTFSAVDPTAGAGLQADCLTVSALGGHPLTVTTGLTAQDTRGVIRFEALPADWVQSQLSVLIEDVRVPSAVKAGVLGARGVVDVLRGFLSGRSLPFVLDPVLASGRGDGFAREEMAESLRALFQYTTLITPNWPEARALTGQTGLVSAARYLLDEGCGAVLIKGEHIDSADVINRLYLPDGSFHEFVCPRLSGQFHGSGCTLASAIATNLALGLELPLAVEQGLGFTFSALKQAFSVGQGQLIPNRFGVNKS